MFCSKCEKKIIETDRYCPFCGQENTNKKEKLNREIKGLLFNWKLILLGVFIFFVVKVFGSALSPMIYPEKETGGWTEKEKQAFFESCRNTAFSISGFSPEESVYAWHYAGLYCKCILEQTMILHPAKPPSDIIIGDFDKMKEVENMGSYCLWKIGF
jgi:hypothetical protein